MFGRVPPFLRRGVPVAFGGVGQLLHFFTPNPNSAAATRFLFPGGGLSTLISDAQRRFIRVPRAGRLSTMWVRSRTAGTGSGTTTYVVEVNSVDTALLVSISQAASPHDGSNLADVITVAAGDRVSVETTWPSSLPTADPLDISVSFLYQVT